MTHQPHVPEHPGQHPAPPQSGYPVPPNTAYQQYSQHPNPYQHSGGPFLPPVSGLRVAAGILGIVTSLWSVVLAIGTGSVFAPAALISGLVALGMLILGIIQIAKARSRDAGLPLGLLATTAAGIAGAVYAATIGLTGGAFVFIAISVFLPAALLSLLAFLQARTVGRSS